MSTNFLELIYIVLRSLKQKKLRSILSTLGVIFGVISIVTMFSVGEGIKRKTLKQIEQLGINNIILKTLELTEAQKIHAKEHLSYGLSKEDVEKIKLTIPFIDTVAPIKDVKASIIGVSDELYPDVLAVSKEAQLVENISISSGRFISDLDISERNMVCVLGYEISKKLGTKGRCGAYVRIESEMYKIIGLLKRREFNSEENSVIKIQDSNRAVLIPITTIEYIEPGSPEGFYSEVRVKVSSKNKIINVSKQISSLLKRSHKYAEDYQIIVPLELLNKERQTQNTFNIFLGSIAFISLLVGGIGIMNIMLANVSERTREIGIRRAIGANQNHIKMQFLLEAVIISFFGGIFGLIFGSLIVLFISILGRWMVVLNVWIIFFAVSMSFLVGISSGIYPAINASKKDPVEALRYG
jgi:putative ABC transport system permease protein